MTGRMAVLALIGLAALLPGMCSAQTPVYMQLTIDGNPVTGDCAIASLGRAGSTALLSFESNVTAPYDLASGRLAGRVGYEPIVIRKRPGVLTPLLMKALVTHQPVEAKFLFFRPSPNGSGQEEHFLTVEIKGASLAGIRFVTAEQSPSAQAAETREEVTFVYQRIVWTYMANGTTFEDSVDALASTSVGDTNPPAPGTGLKPPRILLPGQGQRINR